MSLALLAVVGTAVLYVVVVAGAVRYACQNSQPAERLVAELVVSPLVEAGFQELLDAVCGPRPQEVSDVREER